MSTLSLSFLGPPLVSLDGAGVKPNRRKVIALLAYLAVTGCPQSRDSLAELLYPGHDREQAYSDLRQTLSALRILIGEEWLEADRTAVALAKRRGLRIDRVEFQRLVEACRGAAETEEPLRRAAELVRGPFLAGFSLKDCPEFEEWQAAQAETLRRDECWVLERLVETGEEREEYPAAIEWCRKLLALDPLEEGVHRRLMLLHALAGKRTAALAQYTRLAAILRKELGEQPAAETEELRQRIASRLLKSAAGPASRKRRTAAAPSDAAAGSAPPRPFVGRATERARLVRVIAEAQRGTGRVVVVVGEAGIGKTRLLEEAAGAVAESAALVLWGRCHDDKGLSPFWPWRQALAQLVRKTGEKLLRQWVGARGAVLAELVPDLEEVVGKPPPPLANGDPEARRFRLFEAVARLIRAASDSRPIVLALDDIHWADAGTLRLLEFMARGVGDCRLVILAACRDVENDRTHPLVHTLGELGRERAYERMELDALSREEIGQLATATAGAASSEDMVALLWEKTQGNPLFVLELLRSSGWGVGSAPGADDERHARELVVPPNVRAVIRQRLEGLSAGCVEVLVAAAAIGPEIDLNLLARATGRSARELLGLVGEASAARVVTERPDRAGFAFSHPLVQECLAGELAGARRAEVHARIASALEETYGATAEKHAIEIAHHLGQALPLVEPEKIVRYSLLAGEQALTAFDAEAATRHFERGLQAKGTIVDDAETAWLRFGLARALLPTPLFPLGFIMEANGDDVRGFVALAAAFDYFEKAGDADAAVRVAEQPWHFVSRSGEHHSLFDRALRQVQPGSVQEGRILLLKAHEDFWRTSDYAASCRLFDRALRLARSQRDRFLELRALTVRIHLDADVAPIEVMREKIHQALVVLQDVDDPLSEHTVRLRACNLATTDGDLDAAEAHAGRMATISIRLRSVSHQLLGLLAAAEVAWLRGDSTAARATSDRAIALRSDLQIWRQHVGWRARLELELGDRHAGEEYLATFLAELERIGIGPNFDSVTSVETLLWIARLTGSTAAASAARRAIDAWPDRWGDSGEADAGPWAWWRPTLAIASALDCVLRGNAATAERVRRWLSQFRGYCLMGYSLSKSEALGLLDLTVGDADAAVAHFQGALASYRRGNMKPSLAWCSSDCAEALLARGGVGDRKRAGELLREGLAIAESLGMQPLAERIRGLQRRR